MISSCLYQIVKLFFVSDNSYAITSLFLKYIKDLLLFLNVVLWNVPLVANTEFANEN